MSFIHPSKRPPRLEKGDLVAVISPSGPISEDRLENGIKHMESLGFPVLHLPGYLSPTDYLAGSDERRLAELRAVAERDDVRAVFAARGGYGLMRLLGQLPYRLLSDKPKLWIGFSDITALHAALNRRAGLLTVHGPNLGSLPDAPETVRENLFALLGGVSPPRPLFPKPAACWRPGKARGRLIPGNLSILTRLVGTPFFPDLSGAILAIEDVGEAAYRVDRMLTHLELAGALDRIAGLVLGRFTMDGLTEADRGRHEGLIRKRVLELADARRLPVLGDAPFGHVDENHPLPFGAEVRMDTETGTLERLENIVE